MKCFLKVLYMKQPYAHLNNEPFDTLYPPPVFTFRLFRLGDNYSDTGGSPGYIWAISICSALS